MPVATHRLRVLCTAAPAVLAASVACAQTVTVPATANIYGAGHAAPPSSCNTPIGPGSLPILVTVPTGAESVELQNAGGSVLFCPTCGPENGPDGVSAAQFILDPLAGISGISATRARFLEGVFLSAAEPVDPAPPELSFTDFSFQQLNPLTAQHFFIGDGLTGTGSGAAQRFVLAPGATRLFLGLSDGFTPCVGAYSDNSGFFTATVLFYPCGGITACCDSIDFNNDGLFPDTTDIDDFLNVFSGGPCSNDPNCGDIDFNNDGLFPDTADIDALLSIFSGGPCL